MNIRPVVMQGDPARIGMSDGLQAKPILYFAFLPVHGWLFGCERWKLGMVGLDWGPHNQIPSVAQPFKCVVVEEDTFCGTPVLGEHRNQSGFELSSEAFDKSPDVRISDM